MINDIKQLIFSLSRIMSVCGHEYRGEKELLSLVGDSFDEYIHDRSGTYIFVRRCGAENAPVLMLDAHFDEIGMVVTDIHEGGYLSFESLGGLDLRVLPAAEVTVYGKKELYGVICSKPPHLQKPGESKKLTPLKDLLIDTGMTEEELRKYVSVGTPAGFYEKPAELLGGRICGRGLDNKSCCAAAILGVLRAPREKMTCDVFLTLSSREEESLAGGCCAAAYGIKPDIAVVTDVTFAAFPGVKEYECGKMGGGPVVSLSAVCDRRLTERIIGICDENGIPCQRTVDAVSTGTNATMLALCGDGIPCAVVSVPLSSMHTYNEIIDTGDAEQAAQLFTHIICDRHLFA